MIYKRFSCLSRMPRHLLSKEMHTKLTQWRIAFFVHSDLLLERLFNIVPLLLQDEGPGVSTTNSNPRIQFQQRNWSLNSHLAHQRLKPPVDPRSARPCPDPQLTQARGRHMSTEHWSRERSDLRTVGHVHRDAAKRTRQSELLTRKWSLSLKNLKLHASKGENALSLSYEAARSRPIGHSHCALSNISNLFKKKKTYRHWVLKELHQTKVIAAGQ